MVVNIFNVLVFMAVVVDVAMIQPTGPEGRLALICMSL